MTDLAAAGVRARVRDDVVYREFEGQLVLTSLTAGGFLRLDDIGRRIWEGLVNGQAVEGIVAGLTATYDVAPEECEREVDRFLQDLAARGLVVVEGA